jgi:hypothetical protein
LWSQELTKPVFPCSDWDLSEQIKGLRLPLGRRAEREVLTLLEFLLEPWKGWLLTWD